jgi:hypothetical protein
MKALLRNTGRISMSIATLVIMLHLLIPHDHHQENFCSHDDTIPLQESHHSPIPSHCHAFNDLTTGEKHQLIIKTVTFENFTDLFNEEYSTPVLALVKQSRINHFPNIPNSYLSRESSLRAPPAIS